MLIVIYSGLVMNTITACLAALAALIGAPAFAADTVIKASPPTVAPPPSWTGFYIGANIGGVWTHTDGTWNPLPSPAAFNANSLTGTIDASGVAGGLHGGYNWQLAPSFVAGIEGDWTWTNANHSFTQGWTFFGTMTPVAGSFTTMSTKLDWLASIRGRFGYLVTPTLLAYVTGGGAWGKIDYAANDFNGPGGGGGYFTAVAFSNTVSGYAVGGGLEWKMTNNWLLRGEYLFYRLAGASAVGTSPAFPTNPSGYVWSNTSINEGRVGLSYQF
jgi:outer membrane immunogenic protein